MENGRRKTKMTQSKVQKKMKKTDCYHHDIRRWKKESFPNEIKLRRGIV